MTALGRCRCLAGTACHDDDIGHGRGCIFDATRTVRGVPFCDHCAEYHEFWNAKRDPVPLTDPASYRFQVLLWPADSSHAGRVVWEEPPGREIQWSVASRCASAWVNGSEYANAKRSRVCVAVKPLWTGEEPRCEYFIDYPAPKLSPEMCVDQARIALGSAREMMARSPKAPMARQDYEQAAKFLKEAASFMEKAAGCAEGASCTTPI